MKFVLIKRAGLQVLGFCAVVMIAGVYVVAIGWEQRGARFTDVSSVSSADMSTGVTETQSIPPSYATVSKAVPLIRGPAPLPSEEQGHPGDN
jgi:hypothetical protein